MTKPINELSSFREKIHEVIFGVHTRAGLVFDLLLLIMIVLSVFASSVETVDWVREGWTDEEGVHPGWHDQLMVAKWFFTILFTLEYFTRIYCARRPFRYIFSFWGIIDLLSILPDYLLLLVGVTGTQNSFSVIRSLRLLRVFRIMNLSWFQREGEDLWSAIWKARAKVIVFLMVVMIIVTIAGTVMYEIEHSTKDSGFTSIPNGIYWAIVTMTTVGFGDIVPQTTVGKIISAVLILLGYSLIIVPTGFVSAEVIDSKKRRNAESSQKCNICDSRGHESDAKFCKYCGEKL